MYQVNVYVNHVMIDVAGVFDDLDDAIQAGKDSVGAMRNAHFDVMKLGGERLRTEQRHTSAVRVALRNRPEPILQDAVRRTEIAAARAALSEPPNVVYRSRNR